MLASRRLLIPLLGMLAVVIGFLLWGNLNGNLVYYLTPSEALDRQADFTQGERFRLGGLVQEGSVHPTADGVTFIVDDGARQISVAHTGSPPQLFGENIGVVVEGNFVGEEFHSDELLVRHDEQYRAPDDDGVYVPPGQRG